MENDYKFICSKCGREVIISAPHLIKDKMNDAQKRKIEKLHVCKKKAPD